MKSKSTGLPFSDDSETICPSLSASVMSGKQSEASWTANPARSPASSAWRRQPARRPLSFRTAYYIGRSVHRFRSGRPGASRGDPYLPGGLAFISCVPTLAPLPARSFETKLLPARHSIAWMGFRLPRASGVTCWPPQKRIAGPLAARVPIRALQ